MRGLRTCGGGNAKRWKMRRLPQVSGSHFVTPTYSFGELCYLFIYLFGTGSSGVQAGLELLTLLPQPPEYSAVTTI